jgi:hypothetical protein
MEITKSTHILTVTTKLCIEWKPACIEKTNILSPTISEKHTLRSLANVLI